MRVFAITSGKGGVGKTTISVNLAKQLSLGGYRTLLVDFDIHNKGATSLFLDKLEDLEQIEHQESLAGLMATQVSGRDITAVQPLVVDLHPAGNLLFIPATKPKELVEWSTFEQPNVVLVDTLKGLLRVVTERLRVDIIVIDCYGGIDSMTVAAAGIADDTIIINEPDVITFSGTLLLYSYLSKVYESAPTIPHIHFVVNRITSKHNYDFLAVQYAKHLSSLAVDQRILAYLPFDRLVMDTFGEYPFFTELLPKSLLTKKLRLLLYTLLQGTPGIKDFQDIVRMRERARLRIFRRTLETRFADPELILRAFVSIPLWLIIPISAILILPEASQGQALSYYVVWQLVHIPLYLLVVLVLALGVFEPMQVSRWLARAARYQVRKSALAKRESLLMRSIKAIAGFIYSMIPGLAGITLLGLLISNGADQLSLGWRDIRNWRGQISGVLANRDLSGLRMASDSGFSQGASLSATDLSGSDLMSTTISGVRLDGANLDSARLNSAKLSSSSFRRATLRSADLTDAECEGSDFTGADLRQSSLPNLNAFKNSKLLQANFEGATVEIGVLCYAQLQGARLSQAQGEAVNAWWNVHKATEKSYDAILLATKQDLSAPDPPERASSAEVENLLRLRKYDLQRSLELERLLGRDTPSGRPK